MSSRPSHHHRRRAHDRHAPRRSETGGASIGTSLRAIRPPSARAIGPGAVLLARVPYADGPGEKLRPAVVLSVAGDALTAAPLSSAATRSEHGAVEVAEWEAAGLTRPCGAYAWRPVSLDRRRDLLELVGWLSPRDWAAIGRARTRAA